MKTETASWQEAEEFDELKKIKFEGKLERSLELLKQFLEYGEAQEKELREKEDSLNQDIRKSEEAQNLVAQKRNLELKKKKAEKDLEEQMRSELLTRRRINTTSTACSRSGGKI